MTAETPFSDWVRDRPAAIQQLMIAWPPDATVRARPGKVLVAPAPGVEGRVVSWFEDGTIGVEAPLAEDLANPRGEALSEGEVLKAQCDPAWLEIVDYAAMPDGTILDSDPVRAIVEGDAARAEAEGERDAD